jgi:hypothetical protein
MRVTFKGDNGSLVLFRSDNSFDEGARRAFFIGQRAFLRNADINQKGDL